MAEILPAFGPLGCILRVSCLAYKSPATFQQRGFLSLVLRVNKLLDFWNTLFERSGAAPVTISQNLVAD
jgi:hypothetical protein